MHLRYDDNLSGNLLPGFPCLQAVPPLLESRILGIELRGTKILNENPIRQVV